MVDVSKGLVYAREKKQSELSIGPQTQIQRSYAEVGGVTEKSTKKGRVAKTPIHPLRPRD